MNSTYALWALFAGFWCWGFYNAFKDGEILGGPGKIMRKTLPESIQKPTFACPICMASVHGSVWYIYTFGLNNFMMWILFVVSISGFNYVLSKMQYED